MVPHRINFFESFYSRDDNSKWKLEGLDWFPIESNKTEWLERSFEEEEVKGQLWDVMKRRHRAPMDILWLFSIVLRCDKKVI